MRKLLSAFLFASAVSSAACSPPPKRSTFVKVDQVALGKVVVYRNGVAFYRAPGPGRGRQADGERAARSRRRLPEVA
jgi:hypothetical protein